MEGTKIQDSVRYTMTHGEMLPEASENKTLSLKMVVYTLRDKEPNRVIAALEKQPITLPEGGMVEVGYQKNGETIALTRNKFDNLTAEDIAELKKAMGAASRSARPVICYSNSQVKCGTPVRMVVVYNYGIWECASASNITYAEANYIYEKLVSYCLCT